MKVLVMAGLFTVAMTPFAMAAEDTSECQLDENRRAAEQRVDTPTPAPNVARPTVAERQVAEGAPVRPVVVERRRSGKRIPDAQLIGPRGAL
jgi:hypothetical protein